MKTDPAAGLYVHVPFCKSKCPYCDFYSITDLERQESWAGAVIAEARGYRTGFTEFDSLYLGGGTPSVLADAILARLLGELTAALPFAAGSERTLEVNPHDVTPEKLALYRSLGINRISVGVQSLHDSELAFLGRRHRRADTQKALGWIRDCGPNNLSIDLIYGFAGQSLRSWQETLEGVLEYQPQHLSCYQLTLGESTPFGRAAAAGRPMVVCADEQADLFLFTAEFLRQQGFLHYEVSNFAGAEAYRCRHNLKYWRRAPYLGLGPAAHSYREGVRWWNVATVEKYCRHIEHGRSAVSEHEQLSREQILLEDLYLGFRTRDGVALDRISQSPRFEAVSRKLVEAGLLIRENRRLVPTERGFLVADSLPLLFAD